MKFLYTDRPSGPVSFLLLARFLRCIVLAMERIVQGIFEVIDCEAGTITIRHMDSGRDFEVELAEGPASKFLELLPIGTHYIGSMTIEEVHFC
jgi:hypothetical protein